jgi:hypothetical protein
MKGETNMEEYALKFVDESNIDQEHICCAIGNDKTNRQRAQVKKEWLLSQFPHGHKFLKVDVRGKVFIEYSPAEHAWFPLIAPGYTFIQCFWASGRYKGKGHGKRLLAACGEDSKTTNGLAAFATKKKMPYTVDRKFLIKQGFEVADEIEGGFLLLVKKFNPGAPVPRFTESASKDKIENSPGLVLYYSDMCPFNEPFIKKMADVGKERGLKAEIRKVRSAREAQSLPISFGNCLVFLDGRMISRMILLDKKFNELLDKELSPGRK